MKRMARIAKARALGRRKDAHGGRVRAVAPPPSGEPCDLEISEIGARGDALAGDPQRPTYVPMALPGERVRAKVLGDRAEVLEVLTQSADRQAAACAHFGRCGGCQLQHWKDQPYLAWKGARVAQALSRRGIEVPPTPAIAAWGEGRRRAALHAQRRGPSVQIGFIERGGARIEPVTQCPVLAAPLEALLPHLREVAALFLPQRGEITLHLLLTETGIDLAIKGAGRLTERAKFEAAAALAEKLDLARLSADGEPLITRRAPVLKMGITRVFPPAGAFTQPTVMGENLLCDLVDEALAGSERVIDLFSGLGTFTLRVARYAEVRAVESDETMLAALKQAADGAGGALKQVSALRRDLLRTPLSSLEMKKIDAVVMDPPRSGAKLQAEQIGKSGVRKLAYVSCDPATFARDVRVLVDCGFVLTKVVAMDQFRWSPHVEVVGMLER
jgi:23S rRNA (uracil1939-C5)-methyltransferase